MIGALLLPSLLLVGSVLCGCGLLLALRAAFLRGMGPRPMLGLSRAAYPTARGAAGLARLPSLSLQPSPSQGASRRVVRHSLDPRSAAPAKAWPFSSLINQPAAGAAAPLSKGL